MGGAAWIVAVLAVTAAPATGYLQVKVGQGVTVEVERVATQVSDGGDGVLFRGLREGRYWVTSRREGYEPQRTSVDVVAGTVVVHRPLAWQPIPTNVLLEEPKRGVGALIVQTFPVDATVDAKRLGWRKIEKGSAPFIASNVPAGTHRITFCNTYKCIDYRAKIQPNRLLSIIVDFDPGVIEDVSALHRTQLAEWRRRCLDGDDQLCKRACDLDVALSPGRRSVACESDIDTPILAADTDAATIVPVSRTLSPPCVASAGPASEVTLETDGAYDVFYGDRRLGNGPTIVAMLPEGCVELRTVSGKLGVDERVRLQIDSEQSKRYRVER